MTPRRWALVVGVLALLAANGWRWLAAGPDRPTAPVMSSRPRAEDLLLAAAGRDEVAAPRADRDLFQLRATAPAAVRHPPPQRVARPPAVDVPPEASPPPPPAKTPEQLAEEAGRAELAQFRLVGVVFRANRGEAYLVKGDQIHLARRGDRVGERFTVEAIDTEHVVLKDSVSPVRGTLQVSGK